MNWLKAITKNGRQALARELLKKYLTPEHVSAWVADGANKLLASVNDKEKLNRIACKVNCAADLASDLAATVRDGHVDADEAAQICSRASALAGEFCSPEALETLIGKAVALVP